MTFLGDYNAGSVAYTAPEILLAVTPGSPAHALASTSGDVWALGLLAFELLTNERVFPPGTPPEDIHAKLVGGAPLPWEAGAEGVEKRWKKLRGLRRLVLKCLARDPTNRPSAKSLMQSWMHIFDVVKTGGTFASMVPSRQAGGQQQAGHADVTGGVHTATDNGNGAGTQIEQGADTAGINSSTGYHDEP